METKRLILRPITREDFHDVCTYGCDEETGRYMIHWPKTPEGVGKFLAECEDAAESANSYWFEFAMVLKETDRVIGNITLSRNGSASDLWEIGWILHKQHWGKGLMTEAAKEVIRHAFHRLGISEIVATCNEKNIGSSRVMEKCGMIRVLTEPGSKAVKDGEEVSFTRLTYRIVTDSR